MFCTKCGREIDDSAKFCKYCGSPVEVAPEEPLEIPPDEGIPEDEEVLEEPVPKPKNRKRWVVPVCIATGIAVLGGMGVLAANMAKAEKETPKKVVEEKKEEPKKETAKEEQTIEPEAEKEPEVVEEKPVFQEHAFTPDAETEEGLNQFVTALAWGDLFGPGQITAYDDAILCRKFLHFSTRKDYEERRILDKYGLESVGRLLMSEADVTDFLQNSLGKCDLSGMTYENGQIVACDGDTGSRWVEDVVLNNITQISETDIRLEGVAHYKSEGQDAGTGTFTITMTQNPNSVWGGYTLKNIDSWVRASKNSSEYALWYSDEKYFTEEDLKRLCAYDLYLARNEICARHGYIFDSPDLQEYFGGKTWYNPTTKDVPDSALNEYEKANVQLILSLENGTTVSSSNTTIQNTDEQPESALGSYLVFLVNAINSGDYTGAEEVMLKGSSLYQEQEALVKKLHSENITERLKTWYYRDKEQIDATHARITSDEVIEVTYADGTSKTLYQNYVYTCELTEKGWLFTSISAVE